MNIIYLSQNHAKSMTDMRALVELYASRNKSGKFDDVIGKYDAYYDELMDQVLGR